MHTTGRRGFMIFRRRAWLSSLRGQLRGYREASFAILLVLRFTTSQQWDYEARDKRDLPQELVTYRVCASKDLHRLAKRGTS